MKISIWGTGSLALKFYYSHKNQYEVEYFFDNNPLKHGTYIDGKPVVEWGGVKSSYIIIASTWWQDISVQLSESGEKPFVDYIPLCFLNPLVRYIDIYELGKAIGFENLDLSVLTDKKTAVVYGNCQAGSLEKIFSFYKDFTDEYLIVEVPKVCDYIKYKDATDHLMSDGSFWTKVGLFIYQTVRNDNRFSEKLSTERVLKLLDPDAIRINILNVYFKGYFPQMTVKKDRILHEIQQSGLFPFGDRYIDGMLASGMPADLIRSAVLKDDFIPYRDVLAAAQTSMDELIAREKNVDVKITDYIVENYCREQLFYSNNHPIEKVILEYADRIMRFLGYGRAEMSTADVYIKCGTLKGQDIPLYPSVIKALGLKKYEKRFYPNRYMCSDVLLNFEEYIDLYIANYKTE